MHCDNDGGLGGWSEDPGLRLAHAGFRWYGIGELKNTS